MAYQDNWHCPPCGRPPYSGPVGSGGSRHLPPDRGPWGPPPGFERPPYQGPWGPPPPKEPNRGQKNCPPGAPPFCGSLRGTSTEREPEMEDFYIKDEQEPERMEEDWLYMKQLYPKRARKCLHYIEDAADRLEYENSPMFDDYPDRTAVEKIVQEIIAVIQENEPMLVEIPTDAAAAEEEKDQTWGLCIEEMIQIMLLGELHHRRWRYHQMMHRNY